MSLFTLKFFYAIRRRGPHHVVCLRAPTILDPPLEKYAISHCIMFNPNKSKLHVLCYNAELTANVPQVYLNGEKVPVVNSDKHLGDFRSTNIVDRNITKNVVIYINEEIGLIVTSEYVIAALWIVCIGLTVCICMGASFGT